MFLCINHVISQAQLYIPYRFIQPVGNSESHRYVYNHIAEKSHVENEMSKMNLPETIPAVV